MLSKETRPLYIDELDEYIEVSLKAFEKDHRQGRVTVCGGDGRTGVSLGSIAVNDLEGYGYVVVVQMGGSVRGFHPMSLLPVLQNSVRKARQLQIEFQ